MAELKAQKTADPLAALPSAKEVMEQIALKEAEKASAAMRELSAPMSYVPIAVEPSISASPAGKRRLQACRRNSMNFGKNI